jgi:hypothetical protein
MKKSIIIIIVLVILGIVVWYLGGNKSGAPSMTGTSTTQSQDTTVSTPVSETVKVNDKLSEFKNEELGFSVKYPSAWEKTAGDSSVTFTIPTGKPDTNTIGKLESRIQVVPGKCAFPPVTTIKDRDTLKNGDLSFSMISMTNSVQGRNYFDRMYSLQKDSICYMFSFSSITLSPTSKGYKGSEATQMSNNNKAIVDAADASFTTMVKSFAYVVGPAGQDETEVVPTKK